MHEGEKHRQIFASLANVRGDILPYNNRATFRTDDLTIWNTLLRLVKTDDKIKQFLDDIISNEISAMVIKNAVQGENGVNNYKPERKRLFSSVAPQALYSNDISYNLDKAAFQFGEMFEIHLETYQDNFLANSCFIMLILNTWRNAFEKRKSDGKRIHAELTLQSVCDIIGIKYKSQDLGVKQEKGEKQSLLR